MKKYKMERGFLARLKTDGPFRASDGFFLGVAKGLADHYDWSVWLVRAILLIFSLFILFWPCVILYLLAALLMSPAPQSKLQSPAEKEIWLYTQLDPQSAFARLNRRAGEVEKKLKRLEDVVTSKEFSWLSRFKN